MTSTPCSTKNGNSKPDLFRQTHWYYCDFCLAYEAKTYSLINKVLCKCRLRLSAKLK